MRSYDKVIPERLSISFGGYFGPSFGVELEGAALTYRHSKRVQDFPPEWESGSEEIRPASERWPAFRAKLDGLNFWCWHAYYPNSVVCDGTGWSLKTAYFDKANISGGSNCFPARDGSSIAITEDRKDGTFDKFCRSISRLSGRTFR